MVLKKAVAGCPSILELRENISLLLCGPNG